MIDYGYDTDWFDEIQRDITLNHQQNLAILGKGKNTSYRISGSYFKHDGLFIETHPNPAMAKSDGANMLKLDLLYAMLKKLIRIREAVNNH